jgi:GTP cyclohydrolase I
VSAARAVIPDGRPYPAADVPALRVVRDTRPPDMAAATRAARALLEALGLDTATEGMADTPGRMARAYAELFTPWPFAATTFPTTRARRGWCWPGQFHCGRSASTICGRRRGPCRLPCRATASGFPSSPGWSSTSRHDLRSRSGSPSRSPTGWIGELDARGVGRGAGRRAHLHDHAGRAGCGRPDGDLGPARSAARQPCSRAEFFALTGVPTDGRPAHPSAAAPKA